MSKAPRASEVPPAQKRNVMRSYTVKATGGPESIQPLDIAVCGMQAHPVSDGGSSKALGTFTHGAWGMVSK